MLQAPRLAIVRRAACILRHLACGGTACNTDAGPRAGPLQCLYSGRFYVRGWSEPRGRRSGRPVRKLLAAGPHRRLNRTAPSAPNPHPHHSTTHIHTLPLHALPFAQRGLCDGLLPSSPHVSIRSIAGALAPCVSQRFLSWLAGAARVRRARIRGARPAAAGGERPQRPAEQDAARPRCRRAPPFY